MKIGVMLAGRARPDVLAELEAKVQSLEAMGFDSIWLPHVFGFDAISLAALLGRVSKRIEIGTAVVPSQPRHPAALAQSALTASAASKGRFTLGIGLSHPPVIEGMYGVSYDRPARHMTEVLSVLGPLLDGEPVDFSGDTMRAALSLDVPGAGEVPVLVAALGERMLRIAGRMAAGTLLWMTGPRTIGAHIVPMISAAAAEAGRPRPRIVAGVNVLVTANPGGVRDRLERQFAMYRQLPSYRAMIEREGSDDPFDYGLVGDEREVEAGLERLRSAGVTEIEAYVARNDPGDEERTLAFLAERVRTGRGSH